MQEKYGDEQVYVVPFLTVNHITDKFSPRSMKVHDLASFDQKGRYVLRSDAEHNAHFQQLIPYVIVSNKGQTSYYVSQRIKGDDRLVNSYSLGFGGHINPCDGHSNVLISSLKRELDEELKASFDYSTLTFHGNVRDLSSDTSDHLGFVFSIEAAKVKIKETDRLKGIWMTKEELVENYFYFESWSKYIIDHLFVHETL